MALLLLASVSWGTGQIGLWGEESTSALGCAHPGNPLVRLADLELVPGA